MNIIRQKPPGWFWAVAIILTLWGLAGVFAFYADISRSPDMLAALPEYDRKLLASRTTFDFWVYGLAVWGGLLGSIALLMKRTTANWFYIASLAGIVLSMGPMLFMTDIVAVKGFLAAAAFPILIFLIGIFQIWFARYARRHGWLQ